MYSPDKMNRKPLGARIEDELMKYILQEPVEPGQKIPNEFELAERFGVGRSTGSAQGLRHLCDQYQFH